MKNYGLLRRALNIIFLQTLEWAWMQKWKKGIEK